VPVVLVIASFRGGYTRSRGLNAENLTYQYNYETRREFAPYIGINWSKEFGNTADFAGVVSEDVDDLQWLKLYRLGFDGLLKRREKMIEIIPNWHPIMVHFTVTLLVMVGVLQMLLVLVPLKIDQTLVKTIQKRLVIVGTVAVILTVATGLQAYYSIAHDTPSHEAMTNHRNWALTTALIFLVGAAWLFLRPNNRRWIAGGCFVASLILVSITGLKGGELVYRYGLGVMSMPQVSGEGHDHEHGDGGDDHENPGTGAESSEHSSHTVIIQEIADSGDGSVHDQSGNDNSTEDGQVVEPLSQDKHDHDHPDEQLATTQTPTFFTGLDSDAGKAASAFQAALNVGNPDLARSLLDDAVLIFEGGGVERSADEYAGHHMKADMKFLQAMNIERSEHQVLVYGKTAVSMSRTKVSGTYEDKAISYEGMETLVLTTQENGVWKIVHIHWSG